MRGWFRERTHEEDLRRTEKARADFLAGRLARLEHEIRMRAKDGGWRWVRILTASVQRGSDGRPAHVAGLVFDITERRQAEEALQRALAEAEAGRQTLEALMESVPEGITIADAGGMRLRLVSRHGQELLGESHGGLTVEEVTDRWKVYDSDGITPLAEADFPLCRAILKGEVVKNQEIVQANSEGRRIPLLCNAAPIRDSTGDIVGGVVAWRDITERKRF
jgi:PAS domain S-box-containing protein